MWPQTTGVCSFQLPIFYTVDIICCISYLFRAKNFKQGVHSKEWIYLPMLKVFKTVHLFLHSWVQDPFFSMCLFSLYVLVSGIIHFIYFVVYMGYTVLCNLDPTVWEYLILLSQLVVQVSCNCWLICVVRDEWVNIPSCNQWSRSRRQWHLSVLIWLLYLWLIFYITYRSLIVFNNFVFYRKSHMGNC